MEEYKYDIPENENLILDKEEGKIVDQTEMEPWEIIKLLGETNGIDIHDPKPNCNKCYGRGYTAIKAENKEPIPCECIFQLTHEQKQQARAMMNMGVVMNRKDRRRYERRMRKARNKR